jgi:hypothetical protein
MDLPKDIALHYELIGEAETLSPVVADGILGRIDVAIMTKEQAEALTQRGVEWLRKKEPIKTVLKNEPKKATD